MASRRADRLYEWFERLPSPDAELILGAGLERAEPEYFDRIVQLLFERASDAAWAALIANYPRLNPEIRARLQTDPQQMRSGLVRVLRGGSPQGRCNALEALRENPEPALAYLLPDALRASSSDVRRAAAMSLRRLADVVIAGDPRNQHATTAVIRPVQRRSAEPAAIAEDRLAVVRAVWEALRGFDLHYRLEVAETALWFTAEYGPDLWKVLANRRSPIAHVVSANLKSWDGPRLARFLLEALAQPAWRATARELLVRWHGADRLAAILRHSDLLARPEFREGLCGMRRPTWFADPTELQALPPDLRAHVPEWLMALGLRREEKRAQLTMLADMEYPELRAAAQKALAAIANQSEPRAAEADAQTLPAASRRPVEPTPPPRAPQPPAAPPPPAPSEPDRRAEAVRQQARRALQRLAELGPDQKAVDEIAALEESLRRLRSELSAADPIPADWENPP